MASHKILVIDDSKVIRVRVREMLPPGNFEVLEAKDGEEGLKLIRQARPNLIMLDFLLPKVSGWEVFQQIQSNAELRSIPLVLMSGRKEEVTEKIQEPFKHFAFIEKPFEKKTLIEAIKLAMKIAPKAPPAAAAPAGAAAPAAAASGDSSADVQALKQQMAKMQAEIDGLKKQITQIMTFIKQKMK
ncbi:response regulator [Microcoleus sp. FACHB-672]|uniref:response regulator n=1 Tax=Microcoleus sp. FACHB-672 TaxID=2692825 RepID=UPI0016875E2E|nr:response regulator [Microcoleus sp. FACHB-672]MBD2039411.1 response regulator [Microcoleus sp. FACHB-672]